MFLMSYFSDLAEQGPIPENIPCLKNRRCGFAFKIVKPSKTVKDQWKPWLRESLQYMSPWMPLDIWVNGLVNRVFWTDGFLTLDYMFNFPKIALSPHIHHWYGIGSRLVSNGWAMGGPFTWTLQRSYNIFQLGHEGASHGFQRQELASNAKNGFESCQLVLKIK